MIKTNGSVELTVENMQHALDSVTWYNGLAEYVLKWKEPGYLEEISGFLVARRWSTMGEDGLQLEVIWMICVELFGDCGTSPRSGWIEDKEGFFNFIDKITETYRDSKENGLL